MERFIQAVRVGTRGLRRTPGFAITATLILAIGIGLSTAVFTVANTLVLRRLPVADQDRLVLIWGEMPDGRFSHVPLPYEDTRKFIRESRSLARGAYHGYEGSAAQAIRDGDRIISMRRSLVSGDFFGVLDVKPVLGRALRSEDDADGAAPVAVLGYAAWQRQFGANPQVVGRSLLLHATGKAYTIVGVMPQGLDYPRATDFWATTAPSLPASTRDLLAFDVVGRLAPGATLANARTEMTAFLSRNSDAFARQARGTAHNLPRSILGDTRPALIAFAAAAGLLLLITCINVSNLLVVRGLGRAREIAVRSALGASRWNVIGQLVTEAGLLSVGGAVLGAAVAAASVRVFVAMAPAEVPRLDEITINGTALGFAVAVAVLAMIAFGLTPALVTSRVDLQQVLQSGMRQTASKRSRLATEALVAGQVALALMVLSAAALIGRSLMKLQSAELALDASRLFVGTLAVEDKRYGDVRKQLALLELLEQRIRGIPGVADMSPVVAAPFAGSHGWDGRPARDGQTRAEAAGNPVLNMEVIGPRYFATLGTRITRGRAFTDADRDGAPSVVILSESAARAYWPATDPIGQRLKFDPTDSLSLTVVGIVPETRYRDLRTARPSIYFPLRQSGFPFAPASFVVRTNGSPASLTASIRRAITEAAPGVVLESSAPFDVYLDKPLAQPRLNALLLAVFATAAMVLAAVGLFGVMATMVRQRTRELGIRMAIGASPGRIGSLILRRGLTIAAIGGAVGVGGAAVANRVLVAMLYEVSPTDAATLAVVAGMLLTVAALATLLPALASARIDPVISLRADG